MSEPRLGHLSPLARLAAAFPLRIVWPLLGLAGLLLFNAFFAPSFFELEIRDGHLYGSLVDVLNQGSKVMLLSLGMTVVIATGGIDLSVGSVMAIAGAVAALLVTGFAGELPTVAGLPIVLAASLLVAMAAGSLNGALVVGARLQPFVATLILMVTGRGLAMLFSGGQILTFHHTGFEFLAKGYVLGLPFPVILVVGMFVASTICLRWTAMGLFVEAVGDNETASRIAGVAVGRTKLAAYVWCGFCAGLAGLVATADIQAADSSRVGEFMELDAIFAVVAGGTALAGGRFTLAGSVVGSLLIQTLTTTLQTFGVPSAISPVPKAIVIVLVCLLQSPKLRALLWRRGGGG